jgi:hypothetical protein
MLFAQAHPKVTKQHMTRMFSAMMAALSERGPSITDMPPTLAFKPMPGGGGSQSGERGGSMGGDAPGGRASISGDGRQDKGEWGQGLAMVEHVQCRRRAVVALCSIASFSKPA